MFILALVKISVYELSPTPEVYKKLKLFPSMVSAEIGRILEIESTSKNYNYDVCAAIVNNMDYILLLCM